MRALDVGCGVGLSDAYLVGRLGELEGTDISAEAVRPSGGGEPRRALPRPTTVTPSRTRTERFDWRSHSASFITFRRTSDDRSLPSSGGSCGPAGSSSCFEHNPFNPLTRLAVARCAFDEDAVLLTSRNAQLLLRGGGLHPVERRYVILIPSEAPRIVAAERMFASLPLAAQYYVAARR